MNKTNKKNTKQAKKPNNLHHYFNKNQDTEEKMQVPANKTEGKKKILVPFPQTINQNQKNISLIDNNKKISLYLCCKQINILNLVKQCPKIHQIIEYLRKKSNYSQSYIFSILIKYLQSSHQSLWSSKYAPQNIDQLFNKKIGLLVKQWLLAFFQYKNKICQQSQSFINDYQDSKSCKIYQNIRQNKWSLRALILKGYNGSGKLSIIRAVTQQMNIDLQQCGNDYNQTKYLKQKHESTQSQSVKTAISKKPKLEKNSQMITKFIKTVNNNQKQKTKQSKKCQVIHNVDLIYPQQQHIKFDKQLARCIQLSKIPFIMTCSSDYLAQQYQKYDVIQSDFGQQQKVQKFLWLIYHIQRLLNIDRRIEIKSENMYLQINRQLQNIECVQLLSLQKIENICILFNYQLDKIFTYIQNLKYVDKVDLNQLMYAKFLAAKKQNFIMNQKYYKNLLFQTIICNSDNMKTKIQQSSITQDSQTNDTLGSITQQLQKLKLIVKIDTCKENYNEFCNNFSQLQRDNYSCINVNIHKEIKKELSQKINKQLIYSQQFCRSTLRKQELQFAHMIQRQKRTSRSGRPSEDYLKKIYNQNQLKYLKTYGFLIKNQ